jgi:hypothetical protein
MNLERGYPVHIERKRNRTEIKDATGNARPTAERPTNIVGKYPQVNERHKKEQGS